jgi:hypothetical protein
LENVERGGTNPHFRSRYAPLGAVLDEVRRNSRSRELRFCSMRSTARPRRSASSRGFYSIVSDRQRPGNLLVRARFEGDLEALFPGAKVRTTPG